MLQFDWDDANTMHIARHSVSAEEAEQCILADPLDIGVETTDGEERFAQVGETQRRRILIVIATMRKRENPCGDRIRRISKMAEALP